MRGSFWHVAGLCRFDIGELDACLPELRLSDDAPLFSREETTKPVFRLITSHEINKQKKSANVINALADLLFGTDGRI